MNMKILILLQNSKCQNDDNARKDEDVVTKLTFLTHQSSVLISI